MTRWKLAKRWSTIILLFLVCTFSYMLALSVSVRLPRDQAALARTFVHLSSRAARMVFAVSATNITSCEVRERRAHNLNKASLWVRNMLLRGPYLSQTGEEYVDSQSPDSCGLYHIVFTVGQPQQHSDTHQLGLVLKKKRHCVSRVGPHEAWYERIRNWGELTGSCAKTCGRMEDSVTQALVCSVGCCSFCSAPFRGPLKASDQNCTTFIMSTWEMETHWYIQVYRYQNLTLRTL